jgi:hypothetical protein
LPLRVLSAVLLIAQLWSAFEAAGAEEFALSLHISPAAEQPIPGTPATLTLALKSLEGQALAENSVLLRLDAPRPGVVFSTDFPVVEGTRLLEVRLPVLDGKVEWRQVFPIRGEYTLTAQFSGRLGAQTQQTFYFKVHEDNQKWLVLGAFCLVLFVVGVIAGRIFSAPRTHRRLKLGFWLFLLLTCSARANQQLWARDDQSRKHFAKIEVAAPTVGTPSRIHWWLRSSDVAGAPSANLSLSITHLEKNTVVFAAETIPVTDQFSFDYQFTDGSDYRVSAVAVTADGETVREEQSLSVRAVAPPLRAHLPALITFLSVIFLGLLTGRWSRSSWLAIRTD